jgi:hypothetical protein
MYPCIILYRKCGIVPTTLNSHYSHDQPRIIQIKMRGEEACKPIVNDGCRWPTWRDVDAEGKPTCRPAVDCPYGYEPSTATPRYCVRKPPPPSKSPPGQPPPNDRWFREHVCANMSHIPIFGKSASKACEQLLIK